MPPPQRPFLAALLLLLLLPLPTCSKLLKTVVLVRNSEWGPGDGGKVQRDVLAMQEAEAAHVLGQRLRNVYIRSHRLVPGTFDPSLVEFRAVRATRPMQLGLAIANGLFEVERGRVIQAEPVPVQPVLEDETYCLAAHPVLLDLPATMEATMEHLHWLVKIDRDLDAFDIDLVTEPLLAAPRFPVGVPLDFIESLHRMSKWARDSKYGDPQAARVQGGRLAHEIFSKILEQQNGPRLLLLVLNEYGFYTFVETLVAKSSLLPARVISIELHQVHGNLYLQVFRDFAPLVLDLCDDCELALVKSALKARGALIDDEQWARTCRHSKPLPAVADAPSPTLLPSALRSPEDEAVVTALGPNANRNNGLAAGVESDATSQQQQQQHQQQPKSEGAGCKEACSSTANFDFGRGMVGGFVCAFLLFLFSGPRGSRGAASKTLERSSDHESQWKKDAQPNLIIPRPTRQRVGSGN